MSDSRRITRWLLVAALSLPVPFDAEGTVSVSPDITIEQDGTVVFDEDVAVDEQLGATVNGSLGALPARDRAGKGAGRFAEGVGDQTADADPRSRERQA